MRTVCLLAAGLGTRMGKYSSIINKSLLPIDDKAIVSHIIDQFDEHTKFVVATGYKSELVKTYLKLAHPERKIVFCDVPDYSGPTSGPAQSLLACRNELDGPFMVIACDAFYAGLNEFPTDKNYVGASTVPYEDSAAYCNIIEEEGKVIKLVDKRPCESGLAANGVFFFKDVDTFWNNLSGTELSSGYSALQMHTYKMKWVDLGTYEKYQAFYLKNSPYDFSKTDEFLYIVNGKVIKWFRDSAIAENRFKRANHLKDKQVFPNITKPVENGFYTYDLVEGKTLYQRSTHSIFKKLISWMQSDVWPACGEGEITEQMCVDFYQKKTLKRLEEFKKKYPGFEPRTINGKAVELQIDEVLKKIDWESITKKNLKERTGFIHGDFQFDNILFDDEKFTLLDWRQDFGGSLTHGDIYYDIAKLKGGFIINYDLIKKNAFSYEEAGHSVDFSVPTRSYGLAYLDKLMQQFPDPIINQITTLIFLNMAPLHAAPFDKLLFCLALERLNAIE